jgi:hypothetical protein
MLRAALAMPCAGHASDSPYPRVSVRSVLAPGRKLMRTLHASLPPAEGNTLAMPALENDDELTLSYRKLLLPLALGVIRVKGYVAYLRNENMYAS